MEGIIKDFINGAISAYMREVTQKNVSASITKMNLDISELDIFPNALIQHGCPLEIRKGTVKNIKIKVPPKFRTDAIVVSIDEVTILCRVCTNPPTPEEIIKMKVHLLDAYELFRSRYKLLLSMIPKPALISILMRIFGNIIFDIKNIHLHIEYPSDSTIPPNMDIINDSEPQTQSDSNDEVESLSLSKLSDDFESEPNFSKLSSRSSTEKVALSDDDAENSDDITRVISDTEEESEFSSEGPYYNNQLSVNTDFESDLIYNSNEDLNITSCTTIGVVIPRLLLHNPKGHKVSYTSITKEVVFNELGIYMDVNQPPVNTTDQETYWTQMHNLHHSHKHNWILEPFTFSAIMKREHDDTQIQFEPYIENVFVHIKEEYIQVIMNMVKGIGTFIKKYSVAHIIKPSVDDAREFWGYMHKCAVAKISNAQFDFSKKIDLLRQRLIYMKHFMKSDPESKAIIKQMDESLDYETIIAFRSCYRITQSKKTSKKLQITKKDVKKTENLMAQDPVFIVTNFLRMLALNFTGKTVSIALEKDTGQKHFVIDVKNPHFIIGKDSKYVYIKAVVSYFCIKHVKKIERFVFKSLDNDVLEIKANVRIPFLSYTNWSISLDVASNNYLLNLEGLMKLLTDLGLINLFRSNSLPSKQTRHLELNMNVLASALIVNTSPTRAIKIGFDKFSFTTQSNNLDKEIKLDNSWISLISTREVKVSTDFSLSGIIIGNQISLLIPVFSIVLPLDQFIIAEDIIKLTVKYQGLFRDSSLPKLDIKFGLDMRGIKLIVRMPNLRERPQIQFQSILINFSREAFHFNLGQIDFQKYFSLQTLSVSMTEKSLTVNVDKISLAIFQLIALLPKDLIEITGGQKPIEPSSPRKGNTDPTKTTNMSHGFPELQFTPSGKIAHELQLSNQASQTLPEEEESDDDTDGLQIPDMQIGINLKQLELNLSVTHERFGLTVSDIKASLDKNVLSFGALLNQLSFQNQTIAQNITLTSKIILNKIFDIIVNIHNCDLEISKPFIDYLFSISPSSQFALPDGLGLTLQFNIDELSISNDFLMSDFNLSLSLKDGLFDVDCGMESIDSTYLQLKSKDLIKLDFDLNKMQLNLNINLTQATIYVMPLIGLLNKFPTIPPSAYQIGLLVIITPLRCNFVFGEDMLTVKIDHQLKFRLNTLTQCPTAALLLKNFKVAVNKHVILDMKSLKFSLDKKTVIQIPEINLSFTILKIYKLIKMISSLPLDSMKAKTNSLDNFDISKMPYESITANIPSIKLIVHQSKSLRSVNLSLEKTTIQANKIDDSIKLTASTNLLFGLSEGFQSNYVTPSFFVNGTGEYSNRIKKLELSSDDKIFFALDDMIFDEVLKSLTSTEDEIEQPYSISNETGREIELIMNEKTIKIGSQEILPNAHHLLESKFKIKIDNEELPFSIDKIISRVSIPLFVGEHFILVVMDQKRLQLRFMSSFSIKNESSVEVDVIIENLNITLQPNDRYDLDFKLPVPKSILMHCCGAQQTVNLNEPQVINFNNRYIHVSRKRNERTLHTKVTFSTAYSIQHTMLNNIEISLDNIKESIVLEPCQINPFPYFPPSSELISFYVKDNDDFKGFQVRFVPSNKKTTAETTDKNGNPFLVHISIRESNCHEIILITPLTIIYNFHLIPFLYSTSNKDPVQGQNLNIKESINSFFPVSKGKSGWKYDSPIMFSPQQKENEKISIYFSTIYTNVCTNNAISLANLDTSKDFEIPIGDDKVSLTHVHIFNHSDYRPNTFIFFISPEFVFYNQTERTFQLNLLDNILIELPPNSSVPITMIRDTCEFSIGINPKIAKKASGPLIPRLSPIKSPTKQTPSSPISVNQIHFTRKLNLKTLYSQFVKVHSLDSPILLQLSKEKELKFITISLNRSFPFKFVNKTKSEKITFIQKDTADFAHTVMPNSSLPFFIFDENKPHILHCEITTSCQFDIDVNIPTFPSRIADIIQNEQITETRSPSSKSSKIRDYSQLYYSVSPSMIEGSTITLSSFDDEHVSDDDETTMTENELAEPSISLNFNYLSIVLINQKYKELLRFTIQGISVYSIFKQSSVNSIFQLNSIKLDDQNPYAVYPVVFHIRHQNNQPAVKFEVHNYGNQKIGFIKLETQPIFVKVDLSFISDIIGCFNNFGRSRNLKSLVNSVSKNAPKEKANNTFPDFDRIELSINEIFENLMPKDLKFRINKIIVAPIQVYVSFEAVTSRNKHPLQNSFKFNKMICLIPSFNNVLISTNQHEFENLAGNGTEIMYKIIMDLKTEMLKQLSLKKFIVRSGELVMNLAKALYDKDARTSTRNVIGTHTRNLLSATSASLNYISLLMNFYTQTSQETRHDTTSMRSLYWGVKQFGRSLGNGLKSLVVEPYKYGNVNGKTNCCGYIDGAGIGVTKFAAFTVSGFCDLGSSMITTTKRLLFPNNNDNLLDDSDYQNWQREIEPKLGMHCEENDELIWFTRSQQGLIEVYTHSLFKIEEDKLIKNIKSVNIDGTTITIHYSDDQTDVTVFDEYTLALTFANIIQSQLLREKIMVDDS